LSEDTSEDTNPNDESYAQAPPFQPKRKPPLLERAVPVSQELPGYSGGHAQRDVLAGVTVAALALPSAMAYAELAGLSPVNGLYALLLPVVAYVLLGSSRQLVIGPEGSISALVAAAVLPLAVVGSAEAVELAAALALLVGGCFLVARALRLGWLADYFSRPVLIGYLHGVAVVLVVSQLGKVLGLDIEARDPLLQLGEVVRELGDTSGLTLAVGTAALAVLIPLRYVASRFPAALLVVVGAIGVSWWLDLEERGVAVTGSVPSGIPDLELPIPSGGDALLLLSAAVGIFLVSFADEILTARSFAGKHGQHVRADQEVLAMGAANVAAGLTQGFPIGASGSRTAVNDSMGVRTQLGGIVAAGTILLILLYLTDPISYLPKTVLGAVIIAAAIGLVDPKAWRALWTTDRVEVTIAAVTAAGVVAVGVLEALVFAVGLSIVDVVRRSARPHDAVLGWVENLGRYGDVAVHRSARVTPGVVVYRLDDRLFFANASYVKGRVLEAVRGAPGATHSVVFDAEAVTHVDATGLAALEDLVQRLRKEGIELSVARAKTPLTARLAEFGLSGIPLHPTVRAAVEAAGLSGRGARLDRRQRER
jgi:sulfate permease, SulP family